MAHTYRTYLVVTFTQKFQSLCLFVHKDTIKVPGVNSPDLDRLVTPAHHLSSPNIRYKNTWKQD